MMNHWMRMAIGLSCLWLLIAQLGAPVLADDAADTAALQKQLFELYSAGRYQEAISAGERLVQAIEKANGPEHRLTVAAIFNLATLYRAVSDYKKAETLYLRALKISETTFGLEHADTATSLNNLAEFYYAMGDYAKAEPLFLRSLKIYEIKLGPEHPLTATGLNNLAMLHQRKGDYAKAEPLSQRALKIRETTLGPEHPDTTQSLNNLAELYRVAGELAKAEPLFQRSLMINETRFGPEHIATSQCLNNLAVLYLNMGDYAKAEPLLQRALKIREDRLGPNHPETAIVLINLGELYKAAGDYAKAEPLFLRALKIFETRFGPEHTIIAQCLNTLGVLYLNMGDYAKAKPLLQRAVRIRETNLGPEHPETATTLNNLAKLYQDMGDYVKAEPVLLRTLNIFETKLGPEHPLTGTSLNNLACFYHITGAKAKADPLFQRALKIREEKLGPEHPETIGILNNMAEIYCAAGDYAKAEPLYQRALRCCEIRLGPENPDTARSLNNLAGLYRAMGDYAKAEPLYQRALRINDTKLGPEHPATALGINNMASLYQALGDFAKAESLYQRALRITEKVYGPEHTDTALILDNLAEVYRAMRDYGKAEPLRLRALKIREARLGLEHYLTAATVNNLASLYQNMGDFAKAELLYQRALGIAEKVLGPEHPNTAQTVCNVARLLAAKGQADQSLPYWTRGWAILQKQREQIFSFASERQQASFMETLRSEINGSISLAARELPNNPTARRFALAVVLSNKGAILESLVQRQASIVLSGNPELKTLHDQCLTANSMLSKAMMTPAKSGQLADHLARIAELEKQKEAVEEAMGRASAPFAMERQSRRATLADIALALPAGSALVEFAKYRPFKFEAKDGKSPWGDWNYVALVLRSGEKSDAPDVALVPLGPADKIEAAIKCWRKVFDVTLYKGPAVNLPVFEPASKDLASLVWNPIVPVLGDSRKVYISPDGELAFVNFGALPGQNTGRYLIEDLDISYVTSGRDLIRSGLGQGNLPLLVGAPDYGTRSLSREAAFLPLPGTLAEVKTIASLLTQHGENPTILTGAQATEAAVKAAKRPRILHLATHGFFLPDVNWDWLTTRNGLLSSGGGGTDATDSARLWLQIKKDHPMRRSGVALAGANETFRGRREPGENDGILTAEEVIGMDLWGTQLVVISACESGLGESRGGEGVFGLRRAFALAGAQNLVMTLWPVADEPTMMELFYRHLQTEGTPQRALLTAQREWIAKERSAGREPHPFFWAAFVASGTGFGLEKKSK